RHFFEDDGTTLWVTFHDWQLFWGFLDPKSPAQTHPDGHGVCRVVAGGWKSTDLHGLPLNHLKKDVTKLVLYKGTSCSVRAAEYLVERINGVRGARGTPEASDLPEPPCRQELTT